MTGNAQPAPRGSLRSPARTARLARCAHCARYYKCNITQRLLENDIVVLVLVEHVTAARCSAANPVVPVHLDSGLCSLFVCVETLGVGLGRVALLLALHLLEAEELLAMC